MFHVRGFFWRMSILLGDEGLHNHQQESTYSSDYQDKQNIYDMTKII